MVLTAPLQPPARAPGVCQSPVRCPGPWSRRGAAAAAAICLCDVLFVEPGTRGCHGARGAPEPRRDTSGVHGGQGAGTDTPRCWGGLWGPPCVAPGAGAGRDRGFVAVTPRGVAVPCARGVSPTWLRAWGCRRVLGAGVRAWGGRGVSPLWGSLAVWGADPAAVWGAPLPPWSPHCPHPSGPPVGPPRAQPPPGSWSGALPVPAGVAEAVAACRWHRSPRGGGSPGTPREPGATLCRSVLAPSPRPHACQGIPPPRARARGQCQLALAVPGCRARRQPGGHRHGGVQCFGVTRVSPWRHPRVSPRGPLRVRGSGGEQDAPHPPEVAPGCPDRPQFPPPPAVAPD